MTYCYNNGLWLKKIRDTFALEQLLQNDSKRFCLLIM